MTLRRSGNQGWDQGEADEAGSILLIFPFCPEL